MLNVFCESVSNKNSGKSSNVEMFFERLIFPSFEISSDEIMGTTGAGDAFCAGALIGIYDGLCDRKILEFASSVALVSLFAPDATSGIVTEDKIKKMCESKVRKEICL